MKCYMLYRDFGCKTASGFHWSLGRDEPPYSPEDGWHPREDTEYEQGGNGWFAAGKVTADSKEKMSGLWARVVNAKASLTQTHVIGDYHEVVREEVIVDQAFVDAMTALDPTLFDFFAHDKVWDITHNCPPWDGPFYFATLLPNAETFQPDVTEMFYNDQIMEKYKGAYVLDKNPPKVKASSIAGRLIWRDRLTRKVLCTEPFLDALYDLGVREWKTADVTVLNDLH